MRETWSSSDEMKCVWLGFSCKPNDYYLGSVIWAGISIIWLSVDSTGLVTAGHVAPLGHMRSTPGCILSAILCRWLLSARVGRVFENHL